MRLLFILFSCFFLSSFSEAQIQLPDNMYGDSLHAPFYHGVASFEPTANQVIIWTRVSPDLTNPPSITLNWEISNDITFTNVINNGNVNATALNDWTASVDLVGLVPNTTYYYRFSDPLNNYSAIGRTRTAPNTAVNEVQIAVASCSSIYSGYFNAYRRIAERDELNLVIHLGDYIYDFVDSDEQIRVPVPYPTVPQGLAEWRALHRYHLLDPDLRAARQQHPFIQLWDNHDIAEGDSDELESMQAFYDYVPIRPEDPLETGNIYRTFSYGDLLDIIMLDVLRFRGQDLVAPNEYSMLGNTQYNWLSNELQTSSSQWRIIGSQNMFGGWYSDQLPPNAPIPNDGPVFDSTSWDGFGEERLNLLNFIEQESIDNILLLSGDSHISMTMNLTQYPKDSLLYDSATGDGSVAVEFLPSSISRGNVDETGVDPALNDFLVDFSKTMNPHHLYVEFIQHGYGLVTIKPDSITADFMYSEILEITNEEVLGQRMVVLDGANRWNPLPIITSLIEFSSGEKMQVELFPNPSTDRLNLKITDAKNKLISYEISTRDGMLLQEGKLNNNQAIYEINVSNLIAGSYYLNLKTNGEIKSIPFIIAK